MEKRSTMEHALAQLRDLHLPAAPTWWPPAPGWWLLAALALVLAAWAGHRYYRHRARLRPYRHAAAILDNLAARFDNGNIGAREYADQANAVLKRLCIHVRGDPDAARLAGRPWLHYLDELAGTTAFSTGPGAALGASRYAPRVDIDADGLRRDLTHLLHVLEARP